MASLDMIVLLSLTIVFDVRCDEDLLRIYNSTACDAPCQNGTYQVMACAGRLPKLCKGKTLYIVFLVTGNS